MAVVKLRHSTLGFLIISNIDELAHETFSTTMKDKFFSSEYEQVCQKIVCFIKKYLSFYCLYHELVLSVTPSLKIQAMTTDRDHSQIRDGHDSVTEIIAEY